MAVTGERLSDRYTLCTERSEMDQDMPRILVTDLIRVHGGITLPICPTIEYPIHGNLSPGLLRVAPVAGRYHLCLNVDLSSG